MRTSLTASAAVALLTLLIIPPVHCAPPDEIALWADDSEKPVTNAPDYAPTSADIKVDGTFLFPIRCPAAGYTVAERERVVLLRLVEILSANKLGPVYVDQVRERPTIYVDKFRLVTVYDEDVAAAKATSACELAEAWAANVRQALLKVAPASAFGGPPLYRVAVGGKLLFRLVDPDGYENVRRRGEEVDRRLARAMSELRPGTLTITADAHGAVISIAGKPVVTATPGDAKARGYKTPVDLANSWIKQIMAIIPDAAPSEAPQPPCCSR